MHGNHMDSALEVLSLITDCCHPGSHGLNEKMKQEVPDFSFTKEGVNCHNFSSRNLKDEICHLK